MSGSAPLFCEECGARLEEGARFCAACGSRVDAPAPVERPTDVERTAPRPAAPAPPPPTRPSAPRDPLAVASLAAAIAWLFGLGTVAGIVGGHVSLRRIRASGGLVGGDRVALAALAIGYGTLAAIPVAVLAVVSMT